MLVLNCGWRRFSESCFRWLLLCFAWQSLLELTSWVSFLSTQLSPGLKLTIVVSLRRDRQISCCSLFQGILRCALNNQRDHLAICEQSEWQLPEKNSSFNSVCMHTAQWRKYALRNFSSQEAEKSWQMLRLYVRVIKCRTKSYPLVDNSGRPALKSAKLSGLGNTIHCC